MKILLSVAIVTCNRPDSLEKTLQCIALQNCRPFEVVISDDSNDQHVIAVNRKLATGYGYIHIEGPQKGLYSNRNFAIQSCKGTHIRSMDDDHTFLSDHIGKCIAAIEMDPNAVWVIGEYYPDDENIKGLDEWKIDPHKGLTGLSRSIPGQMHPRGFAYIPASMKEYYGLACGSTIYPATVKEKKIYYFDFYRFGILYLEYGSRLYKSGFTIRHLNTTYIIHHCGVNDLSVQHQSINEGAKVFAMLMYSFKNNVSLKNILLTIIQITQDIIKGNYAPSLVIEAYRNYKKTFQQTCK